MSTFVFDTANYEIYKQQLDLEGGTFKWVPVGTGYTPDRAHDVFDNGEDDSTDPSAHEIVASDYVGGWGGASRAAVAITLALDKTNHRTRITHGNISFGAIGGDVNDTIAHLLLIKEGDSDDTTSRLIMCLSAGNKVTDGSEALFLTNAVGVGVSRSLAT